MLVRLQAVHRRWMASGPWRPETDFGGSQRVIAMRENFQELMAERYKTMIEELTERKVVAFLSKLTSNRISPSRSSSSTVPSTDSGPQR